MTPVLQIVHISDLHVVASTSPFRPSTRDHRLWVRLLSRYIEGSSKLKWNEGTPVHSTEAYAAFRAFIADAVRADEEWFPEVGPRPATWLVNTGDSTTFGDAPAMKLAEDYDAKLGKDLDDAPQRRIFGNHDAWPAMFPLLATGQDIELQRQRVGGRPGWSTKDWLQKPLSVAIPGTKSRIELFAISSVLFGQIENTKALGGIADTALAALRDAIERRSRPQSEYGDFRILAVHHPVDFPYGRSESNALGKPYLPKTNVLTDVERVVDALSAPAPDRKGPLIHLILSGHTHVGYPAHGKLPSEVPRHNKGKLHPYQLQLVNGALLSPPDRDPAASKRSIGGAFQAQIVRFYTEGVPGQLAIRRWVLVKSPGSSYIVPMHHGLDYEELVFAYASPDA